MIENSRALSVDCGPITWFVMHVVSKYTKVKARLVRAFVDQSLPEPDAHDIMEVFVNLSQKVYDGRNARLNEPDTRWVVVDVDKRLLPTDRQGNVLNAVQLMALVKSSNLCDILRPHYRALPLHGRSGSNFAVDVAYFYRRYLGGALAMTAEDGSFQRTFCMCVTEKDRRYTPRRCVFERLFVSADTIFNKMAECYANTSAYYKQVSQSDTLCGDAHDFSTLFY